MATAEKPVLSKYKDRMDKAISALRDEFATLRTGRASAGLLDQVMVEAYGSTVPINQVGAVSVPEPRSINVNIWDKGLVVSVEKAIRNSGLGLNPVVDGMNLRIPIPPLSEERRKELQKLAGQFAESARVAVRNVRRDGMELIKRIEKAGGLSEDQAKARSNDVQKVTDTHIKLIDDLLKHKAEEIMQV